MPKRTRAYREFLLEELADPVFAAEYLNEARQESRPIFLKALRNVAEARRMAVVAAEAGVNRESLYRALSEEGNPRLGTFDSVLDALGFDYEIKPKEAHVNPNAQVNQTASQAPEGNAITTSQGGELVGALESRNYMRVINSASQLPVSQLRRSLMTSLMKMKESRDQRQMAAAGD